MSADKDGDGRTTSRPGARRIWRRFAVGAAALAGGLLLLAGLGLALLASGAGGPLLRPVLEAKLGRRVTYAHLAVTRAPEGLRLVFDDLRLGQPKSFGTGDLARVPHADLVVRLAPLLAGRLEAPKVTLASPVLHLVRRGPGDSNYSFGHGGGASGLLGATRTLRITDGRVTMDDPQRHLTLQAAFAHDPAAGALPLSLDGGGVLQGQPYLARAHAGPLNGRRPHSPFPVQVEMQDGATRVRLTGATQAPFDFRGFDLDAQAEGPNLADLIYLFNLLAPNSRAFHLTGHMHRAGKLFILTKLQAQLGESDLEGEVRSEHLARRRLDVRLSSRRMTAVDLRTLLASPPPHAVARAEPGEAGRGGGTETKGRVFSATPVSLHRLQGNDATLRYHADRADGFGPAVSDVGLGLSVRQGRLAVEPLTFVLAGGAVRLDYTLDTDVKAPAARFSARVKGLQLGRLAGKGGFSGRLDAEADARGTGPSLAQQAATADGRLSVRVTAGALPRRDAAALSGDALGLVGSFLSPGGKAQLRCGEADFAVAGGVATATRLLVATDAGQATGGGRIDLGKEMLALRIQASSKGSAPPVQLRVPITVDGPLLHPHVAGKAPSPAAGVSDVLHSLTRIVTGAPKPAAAPAAPHC